jgi:hypothetical protein
MDAYIRRLDHGLIRPSGRGRELESDTPPGLEL